VAAPVIRVAIVDDSAFMRIALRQMLERGEGIVVVAEGKNGRDAVEIARTERPDLMTLDVLMPEMDGISALEAIMEEAPCPVLMISTETQQGAETTMRALDLGAVDFIAKTTDLAKLDMAWIENHLVAKVRHWARHKRLSSPERKQPDPSLLRSANDLERLPDLVVIAASTGGPRAITELVGALKPPACPIVVAQHMPEGFTGDFARHLALRSGHRTVEAANGEPLVAGQVTILRGGVDSVVAPRTGGGLKVGIAGQVVGVVHPSVDHVMAAAADHCDLAVGVILTGMGEDGLAGSERFAKQGWPVLVQEPASCVVAGMPGAVIGAGLASSVTTVAGLARQLNRWISRPAEKEKSRD